MLSNSFCWFAKAVYQSYLLIEDISSVQDSRGQGNISPLGVNVNAFVLGLFQE